MNIYYSHLPFTKAIDKKCITLLKTRDTYQFSKQILIKELLEAKVSSLSPTACNAPTYCLSCTMAI